VGLRPRGDRLEPRVARDRLAAAPAGIAGVE
jgi:hypothetical protein